MRVKLQLIGAVIISGSLFFSCSREGCMDEKALNYSDKAKNENGSCLYDNSVILSAMLNDIGENIILPRYHKMDSLTQVLDASIQYFTSNISEANLIIVQQKLKQTELAWQKCSTFEFGPAEDNSLRTHVNTFPTDVLSIEDKIVSGSYDLNSFLATGYKGLPAIDYLVNKNDNNTTVSDFQSASNRVTFLENLSSSLKIYISKVYLGWIASNGNYIETFVSSEGSDVSSSLSLLINQFNYDYELLKNAKIGIPLGKATLGRPKPKQLEAYYGKISAELANESIKGLFNLYNGISESGIDENGFRDYLLKLPDRLYKITERIVIPETRFQFKWLNPK